MKAGTSDRESSLPCLAGAVAAALHLCRSLRGACVLRPGPDLLLCAGLGRLVLAGADLQWGAAGSGSMPGRCVQTMVYGAGGWKGETVGTVGQRSTGSRVLSPAALGECERCI